MREEAAAALLYALRGERDRAKGQKLAIEELQTQLDRVVEVYSQTTNTIRAIEEELLDNGIELGDAE